MTDKAQVYLNALQIGYRVDEFSILSGGTSTTLSVANSNANRILIYFYLSGVPQSTFALRLPSGLLLPNNPNAGDQNGSFTMALHYAMPTFEFVVFDSPVPWLISGFGLTKV